MGFLKEFNELPVLVKVVIIILFTGLSFWITIFNIYHPVHTSIGLVKYGLAGIVVSVVFTGLTCLITLALASSFGLEFSEFFEEQAFWISVLIDTVIFTFVFGLIVFFLVSTLKGFLLSLFIIRIVGLVLILIVVNIKPKEESGKKAPSEQKEISE